MEVRPSGKETDAKEVAPEKASLPMEVRPSEKETDAKEVALLKALRPMEMRPSGSVIETKEVQSAKALAPMEVTPSGTATWPFASGVYRQPAATPPSRSRTKSNEGAASILGLTICKISFLLRG